MLHLNRPGELSARDAERLAHHLEDCPECSAEFKQIQMADHMVDGLRSRAPVFEHPDAMLNGVLAGIRLPAAVRQSDREFLGRLVDFLLQPAIRLGTAGLAAVAIGLFMFQEVVLLNSVNSLEAKIAARTLPPRGPKIGYSISDVMAEPNEDFRRVQEFALPLLKGWEKERVIVSRRTIEQFVAGIGPGPAETLRLASILGSDPRRIESLVRYLEQHAIAKVVY